MNVINCWYCELEVGQKYILGIGGFVCKYCGMYNYEEQDVKTIYLGFKNNYHEFLVLLTELKCSECGKTITNLFFYCEKDLVLENDLFIVNTNMLIDR